MINEHALESLFSEGILNQTDKPEGDLISVERNPISSDKNNTYADENNISSEENSISLEAGFERLEAIVKALEQKELPLEEALNYFKLGVSLVQHCSALLNQAEKQMQLLLEDSEGELQLEPFSIEVKG